MALWAFVWVHIEFAQEKQDRDPKVAELPEAAGTGFEQLDLPV